MLRTNPLGELMNQVDLLYDYVEDFTKGKDKMRQIEVNEAFSGICHMIGGYYPHFIMPKFIESDLTPMDFNLYGQGGKKRVVLFSGGKCSVATAIFYKRIGLSPLLFYIRNTHPKYARTSHGKYLRAIDISRKLGMKFASIPMELDLDNPIARMRMINAGVEYMIDNHCSHTLSTGMFENTSVKNNPLNLYGNTVEFNMCQQELYRCTLTDFELSFPLPSYSAVWDELMRRKDVINLINCENEVDKKVLYNIKVDFNLVDKPVMSEYIRNLKRLWVLMERDVGRKLKFEKVWKRYFFYNMSQSKFLPEIQKSLL